MAQTLKLAIDGMHCGSCVNRVTLALKKVDGVDVKQVAVGSAEVEYDETKAEPAEIVESVNKIGFSARQS
ncbi:heavy-metal-associated domain-containing protein [uncultured Paludibaculum sp.]|uniref:heavy-metal-associated domain-containing protein n=1 Tax=uncultured Paludibaculum sp. TaxID=1765020 RepID=UPI002AAC30C9|nr:heavy-metal-associated domain-containing protein [uncultured Paludibaculum sp.]